MQNNQLDWKNDKALVTIVDELQHIHACHTIFLFGSRARGDYTTVSDYDLIGVTEKGHKKIFEYRCDDAKPVYYDLEIVPEKDLLEPGPHFGRLRYGVILVERDDFGTKLIEKIQAMVQRPLPITDSNIDSIRTMYQRMLKRAKVGDMSGKFRIFWVVYHLLYDYFITKKQYHLGMNKSFQYLSEHDPEIFALFQQVMDEPNNLALLEKLVHRALGEVGSRIDKKH